MPLGEAPQDFLKQGAPFGRTVMAPQPGQTGERPRLPGQGPLLAGRLDGEEMAAVIERWRPNL
jgi:hypothetical protein